MSSPSGAQGPLCTRYDPFNDDQVNDPYPIWAESRANEPVFYSDALESWVVTPVNLVQTVLQDASTFRSGGLTAMKSAPAEVQAILDELPTGLPPLRASDPPEHTRLRKLTQTAVSPRRVALMEDSTRAIANRMVDTIIERRGCDFYESFAYPFPLAVIAGLLGFSADDEESLHRWANSRVALAWGNMAIDAWQEAAREVVAFYRFIEAEVLRRQSAPRDDLLSDLVTINDTAPEPLILGELVGQVQGLITAGHESTANWLTMSMFHLLSERSRWERMCADPTIIPLVVEETLRFDGPVLAVWRRAAHDTTVGGVGIAAGDRLYCVVGSANRDDEAFADADEFQLDRADAKRHLAFGRGPHTCVGAALGRLEGRVAFEVLTERLASVRLTEPTLTFGPNATLRMPKALMIAWDW